MAAGRLLVALVLPLAATAFAAEVESSGGGLLRAAGLDTTTRVVAGVVLLDGIIYIQHRVFHAVPVLWRLHRVHHADTDFDVTTGIRFHPIEIAISQGLKLAAIAALGVPPLGVLVFEIVLNGMALFNHANLGLPPALDRVVRMALVTPDMHRVHHSSDPRETHQNFGFNLSIWDRVFRTYTAHAALGDQGMEVGLPDFRAASERRIDKLLTQPFREP